MSHEINLLGDALMPNYGLFLTVKRQYFPSTVQTAVNCYLQTNFVIVDCYWMSSVLLMVAVILKYLGAELMSREFKSNDRTSLNAI